MGEKVTKAIENLQKAMEEEGVDSTRGLPEGLFLFATTLMPCPNIDLFISNGSKLLLTWRDDEFYGKGWHIPGGCLRLRETLEKRIQETAKKEISVEVIYDRDNFITREGIVYQTRPWMKNQLVRSHNISMLFNCRLPDDYQISNNAEDEHTIGFLKWFDNKPEDILVVHEELYGDIIDSFFEGENVWGK